MDRDINPLVDLVYQNDEGSFRTIISNVSDINVTSTENACVSIDNLIKQGIITVPNDGFYVEESVYASILRSNYYLQNQYSCPVTPDGFKFSHLKRMIVKTNLGKSFYKVCVMNL